MIQNEFPRGRPPFAAQIDELERNRIGEDTRQRHRDLVHAHVGAHIRQGAVLPGDQIDPALQASRDLVGVDGCVFQQQTSAGPVVAADGAQAAHMHGPILDTGQDERSARAYAEIRRQQMGALDRKGCRKIELERRILDDGKRLGVGGERPQFEPGDRNRAFDLAVPRREHKLARHMGRTPGYFNRGIEFDVEIGSCRRQQEPGSRGDDEQARRLVEESQPGVADRETLQRRGVAVPRVDRINDAAQDVAFLLVLLHAQPQAAVLGAHQRQLHADQRDVLDDDLALQERLGRQADFGLGCLSDNPAVGIEYPRAQDDEVHPALVAGPLDRGLVVFDSNPGQRFGERVGQCARERAERHRAD